MDVKIEQSWKERLSSEFEKDYFSQLITFVKEEYRQRTIYPPGPCIFSAFEHCPFDKVKVVILGQDPIMNPDRHTDFVSPSKTGHPFPVARQHLQRNRKRFRQTHTANRQSAPLGGPGRPASQCNPDGSCTPSRLTPE